MKHGGHCSRNVVDELLRRKENDHETRFVTRRRTRRRQTFVHRTDANLPGGGAKT